MADILFNAAKGRFVHLATLPAANDALKVLLLKATGLVSDAVMKDYATVTALLAGASDEADFTGYSRKTLASVTATTDNTNDKGVADADGTNLTWTASGTAQALGKLVVYYDPDTTASSDANNIPLFAYDYAVTADVGVPILFDFDATGAAAAS